MSEMFTSCRKQACVLPTTLEGCRSSSKRCCAIKLVRVTSASSSGLVCSNDRSGIASNASRQWFTVIYDGRSWYSTVNEAPRMTAVACIFGGTKGIGLSVAQKFLAEAHSVAVFSRNEETVRASVNDLRGTLQDDSLQVHGFPCDVRDEKIVQEAVSWTESNVGPVHFLVNSSGINVNRLLLQTSQSDLRSVIDTNLIGSINTCKAAVRHMLKRRHGSIVNIGSVVGAKGNAGQTAYGASKAGLVGFTKSLAKEVASRGIRANLVVPGFVETDMTRSGYTSDVLSWIPLGRTGGSDEVAEAVYFLARASYMTGQVLFVDGGLQLTL